MMFAFQPVWALRLVASTPLYMDPKTFVLLQCSGLLATNIVWVFLFCPQLSAANRLMPTFAAVSNASVLTTHVLIWWSETYLIESCLHLFFSQKSKITSVSFLYFFSYLHCFPCLARGISMPSCVLRFEFSRSLPFSNNDLKGTVLPQSKYKVKFSSFQSPLQRILKSIQLLNLNMVAQINLTTLIRQLKSLTTYMTSEQTSRHILKTRSYVVFVTKPSF